jgi:hypothetical protein
MNRMPLPAAAILSRWSRSRTSPRRPRPASLVQDEERGLGEQPFADHHLLLVAAGQALAAWRRMSAALI